MTITVEWDNEEKTVIRTEISGHWTWEEYHHALGETQRLVRGVNHEVAVINLRHPGAVSPKGNPLPHLSRAAKHMPENQTFTVNVSSDKKMVGLIARIMTRIFPFMPKKFFVVDTLEEARALIQENLATTRS